MRAELRDARREWKVEVTEKIVEYSQKVERYPASWSRSEAHDRDLLERINSWNVDDLPEDSTCTPHLRPEYGLKASALYFKKNSSGWVPYASCHDTLTLKKFPNQKLSVHSLLGVRV